MKFDRTMVDIAMANKGVYSYGNLAELVGCSAQNLSAILNRNNCKPATAAKLARALGVPVESIVAKED